MSNGVNGYNWSNTSYQALYAQMNTNSGAVNKEEGVDEDELKRGGYYNEAAFKEADTNNSGVLSAAEFEKYMALYNSSTINSSSTTPTSTDTTPTTTSNDIDNIDDILAKYDTNGNGQLDADEAVNLLHDLIKETTDTQPEVPVEETTGTTEATDPTEAFITARINEISVYIAQAATNTSTELGMLIALEFVGDNAELKTNVVKELQLFAADYINANPDNANAVDDIKNQLVAKYNEIKEPILADSPAVIKEEAIDEAYELIYNYMIDNGLIDPSKEELNAKIAKELKAELLAEANRYVKTLSDADKENKTDFKDLLSSHLLAYFNGNDSNYDGQIDDESTIGKAITAYETAVAELGNVVGNDNDRRTLNIAVLTFLQTLVREGYTVKLNGKTVDNSNIYSTITSFKSGEDLKNAMDECINNIRTSDARIVTIVNDCADAIASSIKTESKYTKNYNELNNGLSNLENQFSKVSGKNATVSGAKSAMDAIIEFLWTPYEDKDKDGNVVGNYESKAEYLLEQLNKTITDIKAALREEDLANCDEYTNAVEQRDALKTKLEEAQSDDSKYKEDNLKKEYFKTLCKNAENSTVKTSFAQNSIPDAITISNEYMTAKLNTGSYDVTENSMTDLANKAYTYLNNYKGAIEATLVDTLRELFGTDIPDEIENTIQNIQDNAFYYALRNTLSSTYVINKVTGENGATTGYQYNTKTLANNFYTEYKTQLFSMLKDIYKSDTDFDTKDFNITSIISDNNGVDNSLLMSLIVKDQGFSTDDLENTAKSLLNASTEEIKNKVRSVLENDTSITIPDDFTLDSACDYKTAFDNIITAAVNHAYTNALTTATDTDPAKVNIYTLFDKFYAYIKLALETQINTWKNKWRNQAVQQP